MAEKLSFCVDANAIRGFYNGDEASSEQKQLLELIFGKEQLLKRKKPANVMERVRTFADAYGGLVYASASSAPSISYSFYGARLAYCSEALAEYAAKQFAAIYAKFIFGTTEIVTFGDGAENVSDSEE